MSACPIISLMDTPCKSDLIGKKVLVTAGPTVEDIDPVRFISNRSTGKMGVALAAAAAARGAEVALVHGPLAVPCPTAPNIECIAVRSANQMHSAVMDISGTIDIAIMAAAVADYRSSSIALQKIKKNGNSKLSIELLPTRDILAELGSMGSPPYLIGFAAESENLIANARSKMRLKRCDMICANDISDATSGFAVDSNRITILTAKGEIFELPQLSKKQAAEEILNRIDFSIIP